MQDIILIGAGGHCKSVIDCISSVNKYKIIGILDLPSKIGLEICGVKVIGKDNDLPYYFDQGIKNAFLTIGSIGDTSLRRKLYLMASQIGYTFPNIVDKTSIVSSTVKMGYGNFIGKGTIINSDVTIQNNCIINTGSIIEHDSYISNFCHIAPGVVMSGNVVIGENSHIGTNSTIIQNIKIGDDTTIGAGAVVIKDIGKNKIAYGNPCKEA